MATPDFLAAHWLLADGAANAPTTSAAPGGSFITSPIFPVLLIGLIFIFMMRGGKNRDRKRQTMLDQLKKGDRVQTIGGILGTVVELRENNEVVVKVDENNNTKVRFTRNAIHRVVEENDGAAAAEKS